VGDEQDVLAAARERAAALARGKDPVALRRLLHPRFVWTTHAGVRMDLDAYLSGGGGSRWLGQTLVDPVVTVVGDTAVLVCVVVDEVDRGRGPETYRMPMTQTWVRTGEGWRQLAGHAGPRLG
jgi:hypothetical protein